MKYTYNDAVEIFKKNGLILDEDTYINCNVKMKCHDNDGYKYYTDLGHLIARPDTKPWKFHPSNPYTIDNINNWAFLNGIKTRCISKEYLNSDQYLEFRCECGNIFKTTRPSFMDSHKTRCDDCTNNHQHLTYLDVKNNLLKCGYYLDIKPEDFTGLTTCKLICHDSNGYKYIVEYCSVMCGRHMETFRDSNPFVIDNINNYLKSINCQFTCVSETYNGSHELLDFVCNRCGELVKAKWANVRKATTNNSRSGVLCPNCDGRFESVHALVLKQLFKFFYPETIEEDPSVINPKTGKILPTDIVNHKLKIAVEIQSQWHDFPDHKEKDEYKKNYWINHGYNFYDPDIRDYSVLEMCQLFFDIKELPDFINYEYKNKLNLKKIQDLLNDGRTVPEISQELNIKSHRIYDAIGQNKIKYPENYQRADHVAILQFDLDWNFIAEYESFAEASRQTGINAGSIVSATIENRTRCNGYNWIRKKDYVK